MDKVADKLGCGEEHLVLTQVIGECPNDLLIMSCHQREIVELLIKLSVVILDLG